jgi:hypothetical protein
MRASTLQTAFAAACSTVLLAACGGGHGAAVPTAAGPAQTSSGTKAPLSIRIDVPTTTSASGRRVPKYVSPATTQAVIDIKSGGTSIANYPQTVGLTPTSGGCSSTLASTQCVIALSLLPGSYTLSLTLEDAANTALSQAQAVPVNIIAGQANVVTLTVGGLAASVQIVPITSRRMQIAGNAVSVYGNVPIQFETLALDADSNVIVGPGAPVPTAALTSGAQATLTPPSASSPNLWTITPHYTATDPTVATTDTLTVTATPVPSSGGTTVAASSSLSIYQPWIYVLDTGHRTISAFDETGAAQTLSGGAFTNGALTTNPAGMTFAQGSLYVVAGYDHTNSEISTYAVTGGAPTRDVTDATAGFAGISAPMYPNSIAYDSHNQQLYVGDTAYNASIYSVDAALTSGVQATASGGGVGPYGFTFDPATNQMVGPSQTGGLLVCTEALSCSSSGSSLNAFGIAYDPTRGYFGVGAPTCCGSSGGINFEDASGNVLGTTGTPSAAGPNSIVYDSFADSWYFWRNGVGMFDYTTGGTAITTNFGLAAGDTISAIVLVP